MRGYPTDDAVPAVESSLLEIQLEFLFLITEELHTLHKFWSGVFHVPTTQHQQARLLRSLGRQFILDLHALLRGKSERTWQVRSCSATFSSCLRQACLWPHPCSLKPGSTSCPSQGRLTVSRATLDQLPFKALPARLSQLQPHVDALLSHCPQYAYTCNRGTTEAIARITHHCNKIRAILRAQTLDLRAKHAGVKKRDCVGGAMLSVDFSRAFDSLPRRITADM